MEDEQNRHSTGFQRDHARLVDRASSGTTIFGKTSSQVESWEEALLLMTDRNEWRSWIAQCARHGSGMD